MSGVATLKQWAFGILVFGLSCISAFADVSQPRGLFASSGATIDALYDNPNLRGVLVRTTWDRIESQAGVFNFSHLDAQIEAIESHGLDWSLAINGGAVGSPSWLIDDLGIPFVDQTFRGESGYRLPLFWNEDFQTRVAALASALGEAYAAHEKLKLVYVTQSTSNGIEGHLQGVVMADMVAKGYTDDLWVEASLQASRAFAAAFPTKALGFEVHDVNGGSAVPIEILTRLLEDPELENRVGAAIWWLSGKTNYQTDLLAFLKTYPGAKYGQVIGRSDQPERFPAEGFTAVFDQAKELGIRYVEPWEYEFLGGENAADGEWDEVFASFNLWTDAVGSALPGELTIDVSGKNIRVDWHSDFEGEFELKRSVDLEAWAIETEAVDEGNGNLSFQSELSVDRVFFRVEQK